MFFPGKKRKVESGYLKQFIKGGNFQRLLIGIVVFIAAYAIVLNGAAPKKYKLELGQSSPYDITATREIENRIKTEERAEAAADAIDPVLIKLNNVPIEVLNNVIDFFSSVEASRKKALEMELDGESLDESDSQEQLSEKEEMVITLLKENIKQFNVPLTQEQLKYLVFRATDQELEYFESKIRELVSNIMNEDIDESNLPGRINKLQDQLQDMELAQELKNIGGLLLKGVVKPNSKVDVSLTDEKRKEAYEEALKNKITVAKDSRIISKGDIVTEDKLEMLSQLNLLETDKFDFMFALGILGVLILLAAVLTLYLNFFCKNILHSRNDLILLGVIILLTLLLARCVYIYSSLLIPIFIAAMLISILLDLKLAIIVNFILTVAITFITKGNVDFIYMALISGTFSAFIVEKANQRSKLSAAGLIIAFINVFIVICVGMLSKDAPRNIANNSLVVLINGVGSMILTIGLLPFFESTFNVITPLKLLELANPNQPLMKRLLIEAPGTYHHSLMVGNLAEVATEDINGNSLLARIGAYYHDVGKLSRPNFFKENQISENPHDKMTPNLSTLVITSHTHDGVEIGEQYKIPAAIRDIIMQHHGTTLVAYFYHKAKKNNREDTVKEEDFRYDGPKPASKEAAVVMLADSVEAAVRSMTDKTEGKIEGLVRKIIKDKLDDGQLDLCELTLKDLDTIARSFMRVFSGFFHQRQEYPTIQTKHKSKGDKNIPQDIGMNL